MSTPRAVDLLPAALAWILLTGGCAVTPKPAVPGVNDPAVLASQPANDAASAPGPTAVPRAGTQSAAATRDITEASADPNPDAAAVPAASGPVAASVSASSAAAVPTRFVQDRFVISFWVDPPVSGELGGGDKAAQYYRDIAEANFTVALGGFGARSAGDVGRQLDLCERYGLKAIVRETKAAARHADHPACWGFMAKDEPNASEFPDLKARVDAARAARPGRLTYINLFPNYASPAQLGAASYKDYVKRFLDEVDPDVLCMDHYPMMTRDADGREGYCGNLRVLRNQSLKRGIPFWNFFNTMPFGPHSDPTEAQLRWQVFSSLAYGAKGVLYFCYWTPRGGEFPKGGAIITAEGRKTRHYDQARRINAALKNLGPTLMRLTSESVHRVEPGEDPAEALKDTPVRSITPGDYLVGVFRHADGRRAVLLNNYNITYTAWPTVVFDVDDARVIEVDPRAGDEVPVLDDSPDTPGLQLSLDAGEGRLFLLP